MTNNAEAEILERVRLVISRNHNFAGTELTLATSLEELGLDSFDAVNITFALEEEFGVEMPGEGLRDVRTVGDVVAILQTVLNNTAGATPRANAASAAT